MPYQFKDKVDLKSFKTSDINLSFRRFALFQNVGLVVTPLAFSLKIWQSGIFLYMRIRLLYANESKSPYR